MNAVHAIQDTPPDGLVQAMINSAAEALIARSGVYDRHHEERVLRDNKYREMTVRGMLSDFAATRNLRRGEIDLTRAAGQGLADLPALVEAVQNKALMVPLTPAEESWRKIVRIGRLTNFKQTPRVNAASISGLEEVASGGTVPRGHIADFKEYLQARSFGAEWVIEYQTVLADDVGALIELPRQIRRRANKLIAEQVFGVLTSNPVLVQDSTALFHANHGNLVTAGGAPTVTTIEAAIAAMGMQRAPSPTGNSTVDPGEQLWLDPRYLIVPRTMLGRANLLRTSMVDPWMMTSPNLVHGRFETIASPVLDAFNPNGWFMACDPNEWPTIEVAFVDGRDTPVIMVETEWGTRGAKYSAWLDFDVKAMDYRGLYYNDGVT